MEMTTNLNTKTELGMNEISNNDLAICAVFLVTVLLYVVTL